MPRSVLCLLLIQLALGHASAQDTSDRPARRIRGYRGIWFTLGQYYGPGAGGRAYSGVSSSPVFPYGDKYSGGLATYTAKHLPLAVYCEEAAKTFFVYGGTTDRQERHLLCMISYYDHQKHRVPRPVVVHDKHGVDDPHDNPSLAVDDDGHLWVFVSGRGRHRPGYKYRSVDPYSINRFELVSEEEMTYPQSHYVEGRGFLHLFTKYTGVRELYWEQSRDGRQWSDDRKLAGIREAGDSRGGHYQVSARDGVHAGTFFNRHPNGSVDRRTDLYYLQTDDNGSTWSSVDGRELVTPLVEVENPARVFDYASQGRNVYLKDMGFDRDGNPVLLYLTSGGHQPGPPNAPRRFKAASWDGGQWKTSEICETDHNYDMGSLYLSEDRWVAWLPSLPGTHADHAGGEVSIWESRDRGVSWSMTRQVTRQSPLNHNYARRPVDASDPFYCFWADGDPTGLSESRLYFAESSGERVWRLPYEMSGEFGRPERVAVPEE